MNPLIVGIAATLRRTWARHHGRPPSAAKRLPVWRLLLDEIAFLSRRAVRRVRMWLPAVAVAALVMVALADSTPGPVVPLGSRLVVAIVAALAVGASLWRWADGNDG